MGNESFKGYLVSADIARCGLNVNLKDPLQITEASQRCSRCPLKNMLLRDGPYTLATCGRIFTRTDEDAPFANIDLVPLTVSLLQQGKTRNIAAVLEALQKVPCTPNKNDINMVLGRITDKKTL